MNYKLEKNGLKLERKKYTLSARHSASNPEHWFPFGVLEAGIAHLPRLDPSYFPAQNSCAQKGERGGSERQAMRTEKGKLTVSHSSLALLK